MLQRLTLTERFRNLVALGQRVHPVSFGLHGEEILGLTRFGFSLMQVVGFAVAIDILNSHGFIF